MRSALLHIIKGAKRDGNGAWRDAKLLEQSMAGIGTKDFQLVYRYVSTSTVFGLVLMLFQNRSPALEPTTLGFSQRFLPEEV